MKKAVVVGWVVVVGCGPSVVQDAQTATTDGSGSASSTSTTTAVDAGPSSTTGPPPTTGPASTTSSGTTGLGSSSGGPVDPCACNFLCDPCSRRCPERCPTMFECDLWSQDCPDGEKCMPWANDGGEQWNATKCAPLDPAGQDLGQTCVVEGSGVSGIDDCAQGLMCFDVDPGTNEGTCVALCGGNEAQPQCAPGTSCLIANGGVLTLCLPDCDPLGQTCAPGHGCFPVGDTGSFVCLPAPSSQIVGAGTCAHLGGCEPGTVCVEPTSLPACRLPDGCCTSWCDTSAPEDPCPDETTCQPFFSEDVVGFETLGVCLVP